MKNCKNKGSRVFVVFSYIQPLVIRRETPRRKSRGVGRDSTGIRTPDRLLRRQLLYPAELSNHHKTGAKIRIICEDSKFFGVKIVIFSH